MEPKFKTSFIPKKPVASVTAPSRKSIGGMSFIMLLSIVIFLAAGLFAVGVFLYKLSVERQIESKEQELQLVRQSFDPQFIEQATRLNRRIIAANRILNRHVAPSAIFELLEAFTLQTVSFTTFKFSNNIDGDIVVEGTGEAESFGSIVLQSDEFDKSGYMYDVLFGNLEPNAQKNTVNFSFEATLDEDLILYRRQLVPVDSGQAVEQVDDEQDDLGIYGNQ